MIRRIETDEATLESVKKLLEQQLQGRNRLMQAPALSLYQRFLQDLDRPVSPTLMEVAALLREVQEIQEAFPRLSREGQRAAEERLSTISRQLSQWRLMLGQHLFLGERWLSAGKDGYVMLVSKKRKRDA
ncbi:hypothetical protein EI42_04367 [Thermosporothrix hazakensis]|jgi:DNA repair exonuclease SbcCD ATPase subunit|uniref:Uncharacterized protein n=1 Tax=Thermosporothrix hazakensis TaxID=644383 RepID=A0A326UEV6_THEHA|nr:hypothetical protein [Thermosporothrix hazakensis]PZW25315.1 hypothetical protein EI42_04367 [Thermosporothrix hazakensis]GCE50546.1 hypothetical protein KTH_54150 [Thermosporothrix hazakensis]